MLKYLINKEINLYSKALNMFNYIKFYLEKIKPNDRFKISKNKITEISDFVSNNEYNFSKECYEEMKVFTDKLSIYLIHTFTEDDYFSTINIIRNIIKLLEEMLRFFNNKIKKLN